MLLEYENRDDIENIGYEPFYEGNLAIYKGNIPWNYFDGLVFYLIVF